ncbi:hypothetical protein GOBAR_AA21722 [Gossypium barbadense]|uniref:PXA domain-containing protein n=1 Tax=Gossypium barbadense TaxID=3634 RepID=A0A2P5X6J6_GOSBA|nr:hypothetical protein GOBAR_AA21722 [Gossypium barbadense]
MKPMETIQDLIDEAKVRTVWWVIAIFAVTYFLSHTSTSMWMNLPVAVLILSALRILTNEVEFKWKIKSVRPQTYLSHLEKKQLSVNDYRLSSTPPPPKWKRKIDSPMVESAINEFIDKILKDFVTDLWYSEITPDRETPELMRAVILDAIGEISGRVKGINLVDLLTRDIVDLIGDHLDLFRRNQAAIGVDVMVTLSSEERDERLKHHLLVSEELHPALISPESEYKVIQKLVGGILAIVLRPREAQCPLVRTIAREIVTCLVLQPLLKLASPYINEVIEHVLLAIKDDTNKMVVGSDQPSVGVHGDDSTSYKKSSTNSQGADLTLARIDDRKETYSDCNRYEEESVQPRPADWARILEAATQRRTQVLAPENLENMWTKGRNYKKKSKHEKAGFQESITKDSVTKSAVLTGNSGSEISTSKFGTSTGREEKNVMQLMPVLSNDTQLCDDNTTSKKLGSEFNKSSSFEGDHIVEKHTDASKQAADGNKNRLRRSSSTSDLKVKPDIKKALTGDIGRPITSEFYSHDVGRHSEEYSGKIASNMVLHNEEPHTPKLRCRVIGAYFEKLKSKPFAVYSIAVTDAENRTWFVKRRYSNFERLHRHLKEIPNYTLHLPPKTIFSSSTEDALVHQRCIQLDKYLQDLLSKANVAEQHEVWDFLSVSSKNYSFGKSSSVMRTLAVNVDDAVDDIVRQFRGVSDGLMRKVVGSSSLPIEASSSADRTLSWNADEMAKDISRQSNLETVNSASDNDERYKDGSHGQDDRSGPQGHGSHSEDELNSKSLPPKVIEQGGEPDNFVPEKQDLGVKPEFLGQGGFPEVKFSSTSSPWEDPVGMPPEWTPPNVSVPLLNLVDKVFQLKRRGWLRRQVFWISKQILQLVMEDAIDDWLLRQIYWLRREDTVALGIQWVQDVLWPGGTFFTKLANIQSKLGDTQQPNQQLSGTSSQFSGSNVSKPGSFEQQLEATRRASDIKKMLFGAPTTLVSLIGHKQYRRCARDIYYFTQSTICVKQLAFAILELLLISIFPEMRELVKDLHGKKQIKVTQDFRFG